MSWLILPVVLTTPLLKIPLIISGAICTHAGSTPPNPSATLDEVMVIVMKTIIWSSAIGETAAIIANQFPSTLAERILSLLLPASPSSASALRITPMFITGWVFACAGGFIRVACHRALGRFFTWDLSVQKDHTLITSGPYSIVRHPGYTGLSLIAMGNILCSCSAGSYWTESGFSGSTFGRLFVPAWVLYWVVIPFFLCARVNEEDRVLREKFGGEWDAWARRTKYKLIPFVY